jgi:hypothetical protein
MELKNTNTSGYVLIATGEYSDYCTTPYRVLRPFTFMEAAELFKQEWKPENGWKSRPSPDDFVAWLAARGYIEDAPELLEIHVGSYNDLEITSDLGRVELQPGEEGGKKE